MPGFASDIDRFRALQQSFLRMDASDAIRRGARGLLISSEHLPASRKLHALFGTELE